MRIIGLLVATAFFSGCGALMGKKVRVTQTEVGLKDPFYVVSKNVYPTSGPQGFGFPLQLIFNSNLYRSVSIARENNRLYDVTSHQEAVCSIDTVYPFPEKIFEPGKSFSERSPSAQDTVSGMLEFPLQTPRKETDVLNSPPKSGAVSENPQGIWKKRIGLRCPGIQASAGHDYLLNLQVKQDGQVRSDTGKNESTVSIPLTVSYNGWLVSLVGGLGLTTGFVYIGYLRANPD